METVNDDDSSPDAREKWREWGKEEKMIEGMNEQYIIHSLKIDVVEEKEWKRQRKDEEATTTKSTNRG